MNILEDFRLRLKVDRTIEKRHKSITKPVHFHTSKRVHVF